MLATEQRANMKFCVFYTNLPQRHYECLKKHMVKWQRRVCRFSSGINIFMMAVQVSMVVQAAGDSQLQIIKNSSMCTVLCQ
jgi:hypothetical protein